MQPIPMILPTTYQPSYSLEHVLSLAFIGDGASEPGGREVAFGRDPGHAGGQHVLGSHAYHGEGGTIHGGWNC